MNPVKKILGRLNGLHYSQDYLCLARESFSFPLHCYIISGTHIIKDITKLHVFAGYCPVIFAFPFSDGEKNPGTIDIGFCHQPIYSNEKFSPKDAIAMLNMKKTGEDTFRQIVYYEAVMGKHHFVSPVNQFFSGLYNRLYNKKPGNVFLRGNLYRQVEIAYSLPRSVSLITVGCDNRYNLFPTDLHGPVTEDRYIISLRYNGKACRQVEEAKKIILSGMQANACKTVYALGKNHMQELKQKEDFPFGVLYSDNFQLPLPGEATGYRELELESSLLHGIHKLLLFKVIYTKSLNPFPVTLSHIHNSYATWRDNNHLTGNYLLR